MQLTIPIYVEVRREEGRPIHHLRPLFFSGVKASDAHLGLAMGKFNKRLKEHLDSLGREDRHEKLAAAALAPELQTHILKLNLDLRERFAKCRLLFVSFQALSRRVAFSPSLPDLWFEVQGAEILDDRAAKVVSQYFREQEKLVRMGRHAASPEDIALEGQAWVTSVDLDVQLRPLDQKKLERQLAALLDDSRVDGGQELQRVGRCLDWLYPDELHRAVGRDREVAQLTHLLASEDNRPLVLVGPRLAGKTTVLHECVRQRVARRGKPYASKQNVWLLSPQRLISGMMYVGQWEGRVQAILKSARKKKHILYFEDFLGLYRAGISRDASLCVADVLRPYIHRRDVRVLAEMTPEAWQTFCERDRGLADQFHVVRIGAMGEEATRRVMLQVQRSLEAEHHARFDLAALPAMLQLHQGYIRDAAFPGKSAAFARQLAQKFAKQQISRQEVYEEFHHKTGLALAILDERQRLSRDDVLASLREKIVGQDEAVQAAADVVTIAKARLADRGRPIATLLFLGPTGVGKTQCAKALAEVMFSDPARLVRLDMNEYGSPQAAAQLVGTPAEPDGLLTTAVRRQPFSVVLLDEIEKAHPDVFDLLLQVSGEGRLTDSLGRTADFTNAVIVMTSNLGTAQSGRQIGLASGSSQEQHVFVRAAEAFFRPEFFNRIDRVIPFESLSREQMRLIAQQQLEQVFRRDGLVRRRCALCVEDAALERIVDAGYHPQFGARALKRAIEQQLVHPVAASLAGVKPELPAVISVYPGEEGVTPRVQPLESVGATSAAQFDALPPEEKLRRIDRFLERMEEAVEASRPAGKSAARGIPPEQVRYFALKEQLYRARELREHAAEGVRLSQQELPRTETTPRVPAYTKRLTAMSIKSISPKGVMRELHAAQDIHDYLSDAAAAVPRLEEIQTRFLTLRHELSLLHSLHSSAESPDKAALIIHPLSLPAREWSKRLEELAAVFGEELSFDCQIVKSTDCSLPVALRLSGPGIWPLASAEEGVHVFCRRQENLLPAQVALLPVEGDGDVAAQFARRRKEWLAGLAAGTATSADDPWPLGKVVRFYDEGGSTLDVRSGISLPSFPTPKEWKTLLLAGLPLPTELEL